METLRSDIRYALRSFRLNAGFTAVAVLTLALGIGANTAIFSVVNSVLLKPLTYGDPGRLVAIQENVPQISHLYPALPVNAMHFFTWRKQMKSFESLALIAPTDLTLTGTGRAERLSVLRVSANLFHVLRVGPALGRGFAEGEDQPGHDHVVVLTNNLWQRRFNGDKAIVGRRIALDGEAYTVVGVLGAEFRFPKNDQLGTLVGLPPRADLFKPVTFHADDLEPVGDFNYGAIGRLRPGVSVAAALAELNVVQAALAKSIKEDKIELRGVLDPLQEAVVGHARRGLLLLLGAVGAVLLIVCVNLANLSLARATGRKREAGIRTALGATRARLIRQVLTENLLLALAGGALGLLIAFAGVRLLVIAAPVDLPRLEEVGIDGRVLLFALAVSTLSGILFGALPALRLSRSEPLESLQAGSTRSATEGRGGLRVREVLVALEVGLSAVLLITAGLLTHSFTRLMNVSKGFEVRNLLTAQISLPAVQYKEGEKRGQFYEHVLQKVRAMPGVRSAGMVSVLPLDGNSWADVISKRGDTRPMAERPIAGYRFITPDYIETIGIPLRAGRTFTDRDAGRPVVLISEKVARTVWPGENPIGKMFWRGNPLEKPYEICGVVADTRSIELNKAPELMVYVPYWVRNRFDVSIAVRTAGDPRSVEAGLRAAVAGIDSEVPLSHVRTMEQVMSESVGGRRFQLLLIGMFAVCALLLATLGIYGVLAYTVSRRTGEIGIRLALGARPGDLRAMVLRQGLVPVAAGLIAGLAGAVAIGRLLHSLLFEVSAADPATLAAVPVILLLVAIAACLIPARRAMSVDPMSALRFE